MANALDQINRKKDRKRYFSGVNREAAERWLADRHVVYNLLPEPRRLARLMECKTRMTKALGCLDYLAEKPGMENSSLLGPILSVLGFVIGGGLVAQHLQSSATGSFRLLSIGILVVCFVLFSVFFFLNRKMTLANKQAAWAKAWGLALRESSKRESEAFQDCKCELATLREGEECKYGRDQPSNEVEVSLVTEAAKS